MAVAHAQTPFAGTNQSNGVGAAVSHSYGSSVTVGSLLWAILWSYTDTETLSSVTDNNGNAWTVVGGPVTSTGGTACRGYLAIAKNANAGATTVTATWSGTARKSIRIGEVTGLANGGELDQFISGNTYTTSSFKITAGTFATLAQAESAVVAFYQSERNGTADSPLTEDALVNSNNFEEFARHVTSSTAGFTVQWTIGSGASSIVAMAAAFKDGAGGGGTNGSTFGSRGGRALNAGKTFVGGIRRAALERAHQVGDRIAAAVQRERINFGEQLLAGIHN